MSTYFPHLETGSLATGYELPDNETIIWHIRQGIHWQDKPPTNGREFTAYDVMFGYKTIIDEKTPTAYQEDFLQVKKAESTFL